MEYITVWSTIDCRMVVVKMRRKICSGLRGIRSVGQRYLVNGRTITGGLRVVNHSGESMLQYNVCVCVCVCVHMSTSFVCVCMRVCT